MTDITGFGLLGHLLEISRASTLSARVELSRLPLLQGVGELAKGGHITAARQRNWASYAHEASLADGIAEWQQPSLTDPQTSGGLRVSCAPELRDRVLDVFHRHGFTQAAEIGQLQAGMNVSVSA